MTDEPKSNVTHANPMVKVVTTEQTPVTFVDGVDVFGYYNGIVHLALTQMRFPVAGSAEHQVVTNLRMNLVAAHALRDTLDKALLMATPTPLGPTN